jgi:hypothetical protein
MLKRILVILMIVLTRSLYSEKVDMIVFSKDRPLQLQAFLESVDYYVVGFQDIAVLCHARNDKFMAAYKKLEQQFPRVHFVYQSQHDPRSDFWLLVRKIFANMSAPYTTFGVDDTIVTDNIDLSLCIEMMKKWNAYAFYPYMGTDITHCYMTNTQILPPHLENVDNGFYRWNLLAGRGPWGYIHSVYMAIYPRSHIENIMSAMTAQSPNQFEGTWGGTAKLVPPAFGLCYEKARIMNIPVNLVQQDCPQNACSRRYTVEHLLDLFEHGWRIDYKKLHQYLHNAPHTDIDLPFIKPQSLK